MSAPSPLILAVQLASDEKSEPHSGFDGRLHAMAYVILHYTD